MYAPAPFRAEEAALAWRLVEDIRLGCLITGQDGLLASHLPFLVDQADDGGVVLTGHLARGNAQAARLDGAGVLVNFLGANTHVSPSWYGTAPRAPTWNYVAVQVQGRATLVEDAAAIRAMVLRLSREMEPAGSAWQPDTAYVDKLVPGILGFTIAVTGVETQLRLSQQNNDDDRGRVRAALEAGSTRQRQVAEAIAAYLPG
ncbi:FMN-binding negative transcriptional regulator [Roseomonas sp. 18066]|uniref:FMN-binding negative transcriptional regulator n=1 Tax=Roseomonas sp. 18066 TaxID=2681412 RepID=UPI001356F35D|nr:FMN-binding negative transcriptional regulator [Roseomonas sp. 18066]